MKYLILALFFMTFTELIAGETDSILSGSGSISVNAEAGFFSRYIYRGIIMQDNYVFQPGINVAYSSFSAGIWCNVNTPRNSAPLELTETDISLSHGFSLHSFSFRNSAAVYFYTGNEYYPPTAEYTLGADFYTGNLKFYTDVTLDFAEYAGALLAVHGITYERTLNKRFYLYSSASISWAGSKFNRVNTGLSKTTFGSIRLDVSVYYYPSQNFYITPHYQFNLVPDKEMQDCIGKQNSFFGISTGYSF